MFIKLHSTKKLTNPCYKCITKPICKAEMKRVIIDYSNFSTMIDSVAFISAYNLVIKRKCSLINEDIKIINTLQKDYTTYGFVPDSIIEMAQYIQHALLDGETILEITMK